MSTRIGNTLQSGFMHFAATQPDAIALVVDGESITYSQLDAEARRWANILTRAVPGGPRRVGIFAHRSREAYIGLLAALYAGAAFVPFNRGHPATRLRIMSDTANLDAIIADESSMEVLALCFADSNSRPFILSPEVLGAAAARLADQSGKAHSTPSDAVPPPLAAPETSLAYMLFTSGTTGVPKAVCVSHFNATSFVSNAMARFAFSASDRFSQTYDLTFDPSIFDLFVAWGVGASVYVLRSHELMAPGRFIESNGITVWSSVPAIISMMRRKKFLRQARFPAVRYSMFCGEPLSGSNAESWQHAAPNSVVENLYGPTELTVVCTGYKWLEESGLDQCVDGKLPIGMPFPGQSALIVDRDLKPVADGLDGELCVAGSQVTMGYWNDVQKTSAAFVDLESADGVWRRHYRTGDLARRLADGNIACLGRLDDQVKITGRRVELGEIEERLRHVDGIDDAVAFGWPLDEEGRRNRCCGCHRR